MTRFRRSCAVLAAALAAAGAVHAETWVAAPVADASLFAPITSDDLRADGAGTFLWVSTTAEGQARRALLRFDLSGVPAGRPVTAVRLVLYQSRARTGHPVALHRVLQAWSEGPSSSGAGNGSPAVADDTTWVSARHPDRPWQTAGGTWAPVASAVTEVGAQPQSTTWGSTPQMLADVQAWRTDPAGNHGWVLVGDELTSQSAKRFESRESVAAVRPRLELDLGPAPTASEGDVPLPPLAWLPLGLLMAVVLRRSAAHADA